MVSMLGSTPDRILTNINWIFKLCIKLIGCLYNSFLFAITFNIYD